MVGEVVLSAIVVADISMMAIVQRVGHMFSYKRPYLR